MFERADVRPLFFRVFRAPARGTFGRCPKSTQKDNLNLRFKNPLTLFLLLDCDLIPRVHRTRRLSLRMTNRLSSCAAAAHVLNGRTQRVVRRRHQRQRRGVKKTCRWHVFSLRSRRLCRRSIHLDFHSKTRVVVQFRSIRYIARSEVKEPEVPSGAFAYFCRYWQK